MVSPPAWPTPAVLTSAIGTVTIFRYGAGPNGIMRTLGQFMGASGATFGFACLVRRWRKHRLTIYIHSFFMSVGSVIRTDASPIMQQAYWNSRRSPIILATNHPAPFPRKQKS